jgi:hypothetical protein
MKDGRSIYFVVHDVEGVLMFFLNPSETYYSLLGGGQSNRIPEIFDMKDLISLSTVSAGEVDESKLHGWKKRILTMKLERPMENKALAPRITMRTSRRRKSSLQVAEDEVCHFISSIAFDTDLA